MKKPKILGITATTENHVLEYATRNFCRKFEGIGGCETEIVDLAASDGGRKLQTHLESREIDFCFSIQGVGSRLTMGDKKSVWSYYRVPFLSLHADNPSCNIYNHFCDSPYVANLYSFQSFYDIQKRYIKSNQISGYVPYEIGYVAHNQEKRFHDRPLGLVFCKSGRPPALYADQLNQIKPPIRDAIWAGIDKLWKNENLVICDVLAEAFASCSYDYKEFWAEFWGFAGMIENYIRAKRAADLVNWLKLQKDAVIIGNGWDFIDKNDAKAVFKPSITAVESDSLYSDTKITFNTSPYGSDIIHERVTHGLCRNSFVISDTNAWWDQNFSDVPALFRFRWGMDLNEQLQKALNNPDIAEKADSNLGWQRVQDKLFGNHKQIPTIMAYAPQVREFAEQQKQATG